MCAFMVLNGHVRADVANAGDDDCLFTTALDVFVTMAEGREAHAGAYVFFELFFLPEDNGGSVPTPADGGVDAVPGGHAQTPANAAVVGGGAGHSGSSAPTPADGGADAVPGGHAQTPADAAVHGVGAHRSGGPAPDPGGGAPRRRGRLLKPRRTGKAIHFEKRDVQHEDAANLTGIDPTREVPLFYRRCPSNKLPPHLVHNTGRVCYFEDLEMRIAAGWDSKDEEAVDAICGKRGLFLFPSGEGRFSPKTSADRQAAVAYLFELCYDLLLAPADSLSESGGFERWTKFARSAGAAPRKHARATKATAVCGADDSDSDSGDVSD